MVSKVDWDDKLIRKAVIRLCQKLKKPILKVEDKDYQDNGLSDLIEKFGSANKVNIAVFNDMQHTISGWPGGKPNADDSTRPERANPYPKRVLIFSPHPDDDVISMGGTEARLVEQGHEVHAVYQTSGNIAVFDDYLYEMMDIADLFAQNMGVSGEGYKQVKETIRNLKPEGSEPKEVLKFKTALRAAEALAACRFMGIPSERSSFFEFAFLWKRVP